MVENIVRRLTLDGYAQATPRPLSPILDPLRVKGPRAVDDLGTKLRRPSSILMSFFFKNSYPLPF